MEKKYIIGIVVIGLVLLGTLGYVKYQGDVKKKEAAVALAQHNKDVSNCLSQLGQGIGILDTMSSRYSGEGLSLTDVDEYVDEFYSDWNVDLGTLPSLCRKAYDHAQSSIASWEEGSSIWQEDITECYNDYYCTTPDTTDADPALEDATYSGIDAVNALEQATTDSSTN